VNGIADRGRRAVIVAVALFGLVCALGASAAPVTAKKHRKKHRHPAITQVSATAPTGAERTDTTSTATCPNGTRVIGGGFSSPLTATSLQLPSFSRAVLPSSWQVQAAEDHSPGSGGSLTAYAFCEKPLKPKAKGKKKKKPKLAPITEATGSGMLSGFLGSATATCPGNLKALSGGFEVPSLSTGRFILPVESRRSAPNAWRASALRFGPPAVPITAYAYCGTETTVESAAQGSVGLPSGSVTSPPCTGGSKLAAVGFAQTAATGSGGTRASIYAAVPIDALTARVSAEAISSTPTPTTAAGYCL
jgi:hypothetical protein